MTVGVGGDADDVRDVVLESQGPRLSGVSGGVRCASAGCFGIDGVGVWVLAATLGVGQRMG